MTAVKITPTKLSGCIHVPPSKSLAHRAIICASLAKGKSRIEHIEYSKDIEATIQAMQELGTTIEKGDDYLIIDGSTTYTKMDYEIDCNESGSTLRFLIPLALVHESRCHFVGKGNLGKRPLQAYYDIFDQQNIGYIYRKNVLDLYVMGELKASHFKLPGNVSSQYITGLLFALPLLQGDSIIEISSPLESKGYIDLTLQMLEQFGIQVKNINYKTFIICGKQEYQAHDYYVEADFSQAAFFLVAGALGNDVTVMDLNLDSLQGDKVVIDHILSMKAKMKKDGSGIKMIAPDMLQRTIIDARPCPDIIPILSLLCSQGNGESFVVNAARLRLKECDRMEAIVTQLNLLGAKVEEFQDNLKIIGKTLLQGGTCCSYDDHRIAMTLAIAATICKEPIIIDNQECVEKSYPSFWDDYKKLGGMVDVIDMEK